MAVNKRPAEKKAETAAKKKKREIVDAMNVLSDIANDKKEGLVLIVTKKKGGGFNTKGGSLFMHHITEHDMQAIISSLSLALIMTISEDSIKELK